MIFFSELCEEFKTEILLRLPVKCLVRFRTVCKLWNSLIASSSFIRAHLRHSSSSSSPPLLLIIYASRSELASPMPDRQSFSLLWDDPPFHIYENHKLINHPFVEEASYGPKCSDAFQWRKDPDDIYHEEWIDVVTICDGLVCLTCSHCYSFIIWNPCIRNYVTLQRPIITELIEVDYFLCCYGFGYDRRTNDYKVVAIVSYFANLHPPFAAIRSLRKPFWNWMLSEDQSLVPKFRCSGIFRGHGVFVRGALHWLVMDEVDEPYAVSIISFDLSNEQFGEINMPKLAVLDRTGLFSYKNSLAFFVDGIYDRPIEMWIMKEYGDVESWSKLFTFHFPGVRWVPIQGFRNNGEVMMRLHGEDDNINNNKWLNPMTKVVREFQINMDGFENQDCTFVVPFVASLVLLDQLN